MIAQQESFLDKILKQIMTPFQVSAFSITLVITIALFIFGSTLPLSSSDVTALNHQYSNISQSISAQNPVYVWGYLAFNNIRIALLDAIPLFGLLIMSISSLVTGRLLEAAVLAGTTGGTLPAPIVAGTYLLFPHAIVEFSAYALAVSAGIVLVVSAIKKKQPKNELFKAFCLTIVGAVVLILLAAFLEATIYVSPFLTLALWVPTAYVIVRLRRKYRAYRAEALNTSQL